MNAQDIIKLLNLTPHPKEGGWFRETYRSDEALAARFLPTRYKGDRAASTCIYYLLTDTTFSEMHRLAGDEVFHFYLGDPVEMLQLSDAGGRVVHIGADLAAGQSPQVVVPRGVWQGSRVKPGGRVALMGCTVAPGFDYSDYETGGRADLLIRWPDHADLITALTHG